MIDAVVVVARVVFGRDEVDRAPAVEGVFEIGAVAAAAARQAAAITPAAAGVIGVHVVGVETDTAKEVHDATRRQPEQIGIGDVVAGERPRIGSRRRELRGGPPCQRVVRLREAVVDTPLHAVLGVHRQVAAIGKRQERRARVVVLLQMAVQDSPLGRARGEVVDGHLDVPPVPVVVVAIIADGPDGAHNELPVIDDRPLVHEPGPRAIVVQLDQRPGHVVEREIGAACGARDVHQQQIRNP